MNFVIREFTLQDVESVRQLHSIVERLHRQALPTRFREPPVDFQTKFLNEAIGSSHVKIFVAAAESEVLGYVRVMLKERLNHPILHPGRSISIEELGVLPSVRRSGIGRELMAYIERFAAREGIHEIELNVWKFNRDAEEFYLKLGYLPARTVYVKKLLEN